METLLPTIKKKQPKNSIKKQHHQHTHCIIINQTAVASSLAQSSSNDLGIKIKWPLTLDNSLRKLTLTSNLSKTVFFGKTV